MSASGQCLCGQVAFTISFPSNWVAHCHCTLCQRAHGAAFVTWVGMNAEQVTVHDEHQQLAWYASSGDAQRGFCKNCGSTVFFRSKQWPDELHITLANFSQPVDRAPQVHAYFDTHVSWFACNDKLPTKPAP